MKEDAVGRVVLAFAIALAAALCLLPLIASAQVSAPLSSAYQQDASGHAILGASIAASISNNACGSTTQGTVAAGSNDHAGKFTVGTASVTTCTITFAVPYVAAPKSCTLTPANSAGALWNTTGAYVSAIATSTFTVTGLALAGASYYYRCF